MSKLTWNSIKVSGIAYTVFGISFPPPPPPPPPHPPLPQSHLMFRSTSKLVKPYPIYGDREKELEESDVMLETDKETDVPYHKMD